VDGSDEALKILQETEAVRNAMAEEAEKKMRQAIQDIAGSSTSSVVLGQ